MHVSQEQPDRGRMKQATEVTRVQPGMRDTDRWLGTPIIIQARPYWISLGNVYFFQCPSEKYLSYLSHHYLLREPLRRPGIQSGLRKDGQKRERSQERNTMMGQNIPMFKDDFLFLQYKKWSWWHREGLHWAMYHSAFWLPLLDLHLLSALCCKCTLMIAVRSWM